jgi:hypothetical protein
MNQVWLQELIDKNPGIPLEVLLEDYNDWVLECQFDDEFPFGQASE